ncbi:MAG: 5'/3'-nucleotidase SurE [Candidatus Nitronauta litoralis]|uniref:5'-nucleotidase SurE n=1 Tax=Candidatus Nitronauta litoralis TaxID=2705533 RepID=A0A7T0BXD5_9BACT|nr:MAG: 5'/3'-nucleotidase SurE [Candidatus Nitronauta litoralis]
MILLTNDDGFNAPGLRAVWEALSPECEAIIIAPETEQSAVGHAITLATPLKVKEMKEDGHLLGYAVSGTPADCVKIAITELLPEPPELVISGVNQGSNMGSCVIYSGTVSAATEAAIMGVPSIAVSLNSWESKEFSIAAEFIRQIYPMVLKRGLPEGVALNINVPAIPKEQIKGVVVTRQGQSRVIEAFDKRIDPRNNIYYWLAGEMTFSDAEGGTDCEAVESGYISITPIHCDLTRHDLLDDLGSWNLAFE